MLEHVFSRYDRRSLYVLGILYVVYIGMFLGWDDVRVWAFRFDPLLSTTWSFMTLLLVWDVKPRRDTLLVGVGFFGGLVIEWWGTTTNIWHYASAERPPVWILPAWPVAALAIDRIARLLDVTRFGRRGTALTWGALPLFVAWMCHFSWPAVDTPSTRVIFALMALVLATVRDVRHDVLLFFGGAALGLFLEYWGTSRGCWTYYTAEVPPAVAVFAHGFASVAFARGVWVIEAVLGIAAKAHRRPGEPAPQAGG